MPLISETDSQTNSMCMKIHLHSDETYLIQPKFTRWPVNAVSL